VGRVFRKDHAPTKTKALKQAIFTLAGMRPLFTMPAVMRRSLAF
jgi:hypothetical protein